MALTELQREILQIISKSRIDQGDGYIAGGTALNVMLEQPRISRDIDLFHDTREALQRTWQNDRDLLKSEGFSVDAVREAAGSVEVVARKGALGTLIEWTIDSSFRFFPLVRHEELGLSLHPFDLATNKVLALVGRLEVRDWIDVIACHSRLQELGYLMWAACGKDPGLNPELILNEATRSGRYTQEEVGSLDFSGQPPNAASLSREWKEMLSQARELVSLLPPEKAGTCVLNGEHRLFRGGPKDLELHLHRGEVSFHRGSIRGAFPSFPGPS